MKQFVKFRVRLTIGVVVPAITPLGVDPSPSIHNETVEHVCAYECDVNVNRFEAIRTSFSTFYWTEAFKNAIGNLLRRSEPQIASRIRLESLK